MSRQRAKNRVAANPDKVYSIEEIKSILHTKNMVSPYTYKHIITQLLDDETRAYVVTKHHDKFDKKPEDYVTY